jgi:predicted N-acetyltransferase YhbS
MFNTGSRLYITGLNILSVDPTYQHQGVGSMLVQWGCKEADTHGRDSFLISSPAGIRLYSKFGFKAVGEVHTQTGTFTSMFREAR